MKQEARETMKPAPRKQDAMSTESNTVTSQRSFLPHLLLRRCLYVLPDADEALSSTASQNHASCQISAPINGVRNTNVRHCVVIQLVVVTNMKRTRQK